MARDPLALSRLHARSSCRTSILPAHTLSASRAPWRGTRALTILASTCTKGKLRLTFWPNPCQGGRYLSNEWQADHTPLRGPTSLRPKATARIAQRAALCPPHPSNAPAPPRWQSSRSCPRGPLFTPPRRAARGAGGPGSRCVPLIHRCNIGQIVRFWETRIIVQELPKDCSLAPPFRDMY
jgi:hypothetical protein